MKKWLKKIKDKSPEIFAVATFVGMNAFAFLILFIEPTPENFEALLFVIFLDIIIWLPVFYLVYGDPWWA